MIAEGSWRKGWLLLRKKNPFNKYQTAIKAGSCVLSEVFNQLMTEGFLTKLIIRAIFLSTHFKEGERKDYLWEVILWFRQ